MAENDPSKQSDQPNNEEAGADDAESRKTARLRQAQRMSYWARRMRQYTAPPESPDSENKEP